MTTRPEPAHESSSTTSLLNLRRFLPMTETDEREAKTMAMRVFAGAVCSALVLFAHTATSASTALPLVAGFGFVLLATAAATALAPIGAGD